MFTDWYQVKRFLYGSYMDRYSRVYFRAIFFSLYRQSYTLHDEPLITFLKDTFLCYSHITTRLKSSVKKLNFTEKAVKWQNWNLRGPNAVNRHLFSWSVFPKISIPALLFQWNLFHSLSYWRQCWVCVRKPCAICGTLHGHWTVSLRRTPWESCCVLHLSEEVRMV